MIRSVRRLYYDMQDLLWYHFTINLDLIGIFISKQIIDYPCYHRS